MSTDARNGRNCGCTDHGEHCSCLRTERAVGSLEAVASVSANHVVRPGYEMHHVDGARRSPITSGTQPSVVRSLNNGTTTDHVVSNVMFPSADYGRDSRGVRRWCALVALLSASALISATTAAARDVRGASSFRCGTPLNQPLTGPKGVITTPGFPGPFPVPVDCEWVIQADPAVADGGDTIIEVYFTQLFVTDGLTITEYSQYPVVFGFVTVREVFNKSHIHVGQSMLTTLPYLVIRFRLDRLEGNHIRVHDDLMDVYGFNITYEMRPAGNERNDVCSLYFCSYSGNCLGNADLTEYKCSCFTGFSGADCGYGPICKPNNTDLCENGGVCRHVGRSIAICNCPTGFTGGKCEVPVVNITA
ncbi:Hypothetical protein CINCED_3A023546, partial [Cinara cedri]